MLIAAAAQTWGVNKASCRAENGTVVHGPSGRRAPYTELAARAASMPVPENIRLKEPADFRLIGRSLPRIDTPAKVDGSALYASDIRRPGMLIAMLRRCPVAGGTVAAYDPHPALSIPGVRDVVEVDRGIAVLATDTWAAMRGVDALRVEWDEGPNAELSSAQLAGYYVEALEAEPTHVPKSAGDVEAALAGAARTVEATYEVPFLAHASMETMVCTADVRTDGCDLWVPTQAQTLTQRVAAEIAGLDPAAVRAGAHAAVALEPLHPLIERLRRAADLPSYRGNSRPTRGVFALVIHNHPHRTGANLRRKHVPCLAHNGFTFSRVGASAKPGAVQSCNQFFGKD